MLHTAAYYGHKDAIRELLRLRVDINVRDYKGATPLHRSKNTDIMEVSLGTSKLPVNNFSLQHIEWENTCKDTYVLNM